MKSSPTRVARRPSQHSLASEMLFQRHYVISLCYECDASCCECVSRLGRNMGSLLIFTASEIMLPTFEFLQEPGFER